MFNFEMEILFFFLFEKMYTLAKKIFLYPSLENKGEKPRNSKLIVLGRQSQLKSPYYSNSENV